MRSSSRSFGKRARAVTQNQSTFNWINVLVVPMAAGSMEAQPIVAVSMLVTLVFAGKSEALPVVEASSILLLWSLYWWALLVRQVIQPRTGEQLARLLYIPALLVSFVMIIVTYPGLFHTTLSLLYALGLSGYLWERGMWRVEKDLRGEAAMPAFHLGFLLLLLVLLFAIVDPQPGAQSLLAMLPVALLLFCLSGLTALSFNSLDAMKTAHQHRFTRRARSSPTRLWIQTLLALLGVLAALMSLLVAATFQLFVMLFSPLISALRAVIRWLAGLFRVTFSPNCLHQVCLPPPGPSFYPVSFPGFSSTLTQVIGAVSMSVLALFALAVLCWIVWRMRRRHKGTRNEDEVRERLPIRITLKTRRRNREGRTFEVLDATSARARYRSFLLTMARRGEDEQRRRPEETPAEYQTRLLARDQPAVQKDRVPTDAAILGTLTHAYTRERYGGKPPTVSQQAYLRRWMSLLVRRLTSG